MIRVTFLNNQVPMCLSVRKLTLVHWWKNRWHFVKLHKIYFTTMQKWWISDGKKSVKEKKILLNLWNFNRLQRRIQDQRAGPAPPGLKKFRGFVFVNFDCITRKHFDFSQHAMFTICILFTSLLQKLRVCVKGH